LKLKILIPLIAASLIVFLVICFWFYKGHLRRQIQEIEITLPPAQIVPENLPQNLPQNLFTTEREVFRTKKQYFYKVKYLGVSAGEAEITVDPQKDKNEIVISANTKTSWAVSSVYTLEAELVTRMDAKSLVPLISTLSMVDTFSKRKGQSVFNYMEKKIQYLEKGFKVKKGDYTREESKPLNAPIFDELSALFLLEFAKLTPNSTITIPVVSNIRRYIVKLKIGELKDMELPNLGKLKVFETTAEITKEGAPVSFGDVKLFLSPSYGNIPVRVTGKLETKKLKLGEITVMLNEIK
jgi:hypothetical protein